VFCAESSSLPLGIGFKLAVTTGLTVGVLQYSSSEPFRMRAKWRRETPRAQSVATISRLVHGISNAERGASAIFLEAKQTIRQRTE